MRDAKPNFPGSAFKVGGFVVDHFHELKGLQIPAHQCHGTDVTLVRGLNRTLQRLTGQQIFAYLFYSRMFEGYVIARLRGLALPLGKSGDRNTKSALHHRFRHYVC